MSDRSVNTDIPLTTEQGNNPNDLHTRIAAAITDGIIAGDGHGKIADAVIEALSLTETAGIIVGCNHRKDE
jgi:hypothetical protein